MSPRAVNANASSSRTATQAAACQDARTETGRPTRKSAAALMKNPPWQRKRANESAAAAPKTDEHAAKKQKTAANGRKHPPPEINEESTTEPDESDVADGQDMVVHNKGKEREDIGMSDGSEDVHVSDGSEAEMDDDGYDMVESRSAVNQNDLEREAVTWQEKSSTKLTRYYDGPDESSSDGPPVFRAKTKTSTTPAKTKVKILNSKESTKSVSGNKKRDGKPLTGRRKEKLDRELPKFDDAGSDADDEDIPGKDIDLNLQKKAVEDANWNPRTILNLSHRGGVAEVKMKDQGPEIRDVLHKSFEIGELYMVFGLPEHRRLSTWTDASNVTAPMSASSLVQIAHGALVDGANSLGYSSPLDVAGRLERGSQSGYQKPMTDHTAHRLKLLRGKWKHPLAKGIPSRLPFPVSDTAGLARLTQGSNYTFPEKNGVLNPKKPFAGDLIYYAVRLTFFGPDGLDPTPKMLKYFVSSDPSSPNEREVPAELVAMAATMLHGVLQELMSGQESLQYTPATDSIYQGHIQVLTRLRLQHLTKYHDRMHKMFVYVTSRSPQWTQLVNACDQMMDTVDWDQVDNDEASEDELPEVLVRDQKGNLVRVPA